MHMIPFFSSVLSMSVPVPRHLPLRNSRALIKVAALITVLKQAGPDIDKLGHV